VWGTFFIAIFLSFFRPLYAIYFILVFDLYWITRIFYMMIHLAVSWYRFRRDAKIDWKEKVENLKKENEILPSKNYLDYYHLIVLPVYKEPLEVVYDSFENLIKIDYPLNKLIIVLSGEERDLENFNKIYPVIEKKFSGYFKKLIINIHHLKPDELAGKGANCVSAAKKGKEAIDEFNIPYEKVLVSNFDIDTKPAREYFFYFIYKYLTQEHPTHCSYQPLTVFNNNIWQTPIFNRVVSYSTTFWLLTDLSRTERLFTFSSHSMSFDTLVKVGYWQKDIVTEDSRICLQGMNYYADYKVVPMYTTVSLDAVQGSNYWQSMKNQYRQIRRWAWGVENFPYMVTTFSKNPKMPFSKKFRYIWNQTEGVYSWATAPILMLLVGYLPLYMGRDSLQNMALFHNTPRILQALMTIGMFGLIFSAAISVMMLPPIPKKHKWHSALYKYLIMLLQWLLLPFTMIAFGSIPAIDAQTKLMFGKYLGFNVTEKVRKNN
jgi:cellulose synthase/poly-beta-1,6-N-acetylglucosamine synthase-like glycosyltransferase